MEFCATKISSTAWCVGGINKGRDDQLALTEHFRLLAIDCLMAFSFYLVTFLNRRR